MKQRAGRNKSVGSVFIVKEVKGVKSKDAFFGLRCWVRIQPKIEEFGGIFMMKIKVED